VKVLVERTNPLEVATTSADSVGFGRTVTTDTEGTYPGFGAVKNIHLKRFPTIKLVMSK
jgi:hypothetical protein